MNSTNSIPCSMAGKRGIIMGLANKWSIAWGIAKALDAAGAEIAFTYAGEIFKKRVEDLLSELTGKHKMYECDVSLDESIDQAFSDIKADLGTIDFLVHSIAYADKQYLTDYYSNVTRAGFAQALDISCYSFTATAAKAYEMMNEGGSMLTLSYYGAEKWVPHYNVMGVAKAALEASILYLAADFGERQVRVNALSPGPIQTLSAMGIDGFKYIGKWTRLNSPLQRLATIEEVGNAALFLLSDMGSAMTGSVIHVDCGYHIVGMKHPKAPDFTKQ